MKDPINDFEPKKLALIRILQILEKSSDSKHHITQSKLIETLSNDYGISIDRKAVGRNIALLKDVGYDIKTERDGSYIDERIFEDSELRVLCDEVLSCKYLTTKYSKDLIDKICSLTSINFRSSIKHIHSVNDWNRTGNANVFLNISTISEAITKKKKIKYEYNKYGIDKRMHRTSEQCETPYATLLRNQKYYLMSYNEKYNKISYRQIDHMTNVKILDEQAYPIKKIPGYENGINYKKISDSLPYMYSDTPERIDFIADVDIIDQIIDWFGKDIRIDRTTDERKVNVSLIASPLAMENWATQYINHVEITSPENLREKIRQSLEKGLQKYNCER